MSDKDREDFLEATRLYLFGSDAGLSLDCNC